MNGMTMVTKITDCPSLLSSPHAVVLLLDGWMKPFGPLYCIVLWCGSVGMFSSFKSLVAEVGEAEIKAREAKMAKEKQERERIRKAKELEKKKKKQAEQEAAADASARAKAKAKAEAKAKEAAKAKAEKDAEDVSQEGWEGSRKKE